MPSSAVVIGAGFAGLSAARVLSKHFDSVTIVDADVLPSRPSPRKGVPQDHQPHTLHIRGARELEALLPGYEQTLRDNGADFLDVGSQCARFGEGGWHVRHEVGIRFVAASRPLLEWATRERLLALSRNVRIRDGVRVRGYIVEGTGADMRICGIRTESGEIRADLVIDAAGRGTRAFAWLAEAGLSAPHKEEVAAGFGYSTRLYTPPPKASRRSQWWWDLLVVDSKVPTHTRYGIVSPIEGGRWLVTAGGINRDYPPREEEAFLAFLRGLRSPIIADALEYARPEGPIVHTRNTDCVWYQVHRWAHPPSGLLLMGDSVSAPNPAYGQGITKAVVEAQLLDELLFKRRGRRGPGFEKTFYGVQRAWISRLWALSAPLDLRWPATEGKRAWNGPATAYLAGLYAAAAETDPVVLRRGLEISQACIPDYAALAPNIVARVMRHHLRPREALPRPSVGVDLTGAYRVVLG